MRSDLSSVSRSEARSAEDCRSRAFTIPRSLWQELCVLLLVDARTGAEIGTRRSTANDSRDLNVRRPLARSLACWPPVRRAGETLRVVCIHLEPLRYPKERGTHRTATDAKPALPNCIRLACTCIHRESQNAQGVRRMNDQPRVRDLTNHLFVRKADWPSTRASTSGESHGVCFMLHTCRADR